MERYKECENASRREHYTGPKQPIAMANSKQSENSSRSSYGTNRQENICSRLLGFVRYDQDYSLYCLSENNPVRRFSKYIVVSRVFEYFILLNIVANCVVLALNKPLPKNDKIEMSEALEEAEIYFLAIFCIEASLKIIALGFVLHPGSYLRNGWNVLDFIVVITGIISLPNFPINTKLDVKSLRAVRVLRPLKLISGIPSLQVVMKSIGRAMIPLLQIALLVLFVIVIYAIIGLEFLMNSFHDTCYDPITKKLEDKPRPCDKGPYNGIRQYIHGRECPASMKCGGNWTGPDDGITTFDNIALSMITVFQCITMEGWTDVMYKTLEAIDRRGFLYSIYFVSLIVIGSFFMLNLVLGVLSGEFAKERERVETRRAFFKVRRQQKLEREVAGYIEWITKAEEALSKEHARKDGSRSISDTTESQAHVICNDLVINPMAVLTKQNGNSYRLNLPEKKSCLDTLAILEVRFRFFIRKSVKSQWFYWAVLVCVFLNTVSLATEHYDQPPWLGKFQESAEAVFLVIFTFEMVLKMYSLGIRIYFSSSFNIFDCVVVCSGIIEALLAALLPFRLILGISVLRCIRLLRVFKVTRHWTSLRNLATSLVSSIKSIMSLIFLLFLFILISALLGMQFFGGRFRFTKNIRTNFDNFPNAMLTVFQILTGEDWNAVMNHGIIAYGGPHKFEGVAVSLYFVLLVIIGNYTLLNVFLAIAVDNLANAQILTEDEENEKKERERKKSEARDKFSMRPESKEKRPSHWRKTKSIPMLMAFKKLGRNKENEEELSESECGIRGRNKTDRRWSQNLGKNIAAFRREDSLYTNKPNGQIKEGDGNASDDSQRPGRRKRKTREMRRGRGRQRAASDAEAGTKEGGTEEDEDETITAKNFMNVLKTGRLGNRRRRGRKDVPIIRTRTLFVFGPDNGFRRLCHRIVNLPHFDTVMLVVIVFSSLVIAIEDPVHDDDPRNQTLWYFDCVFTAIFAFEVVVKVIDMGLVLHKGAYLRSIWNIIDGVVVVCNIASLVLAEVKDNNRGGRTAVRALRVIRVLRPFKSVHKIKKLQAVFRCMWFSVKNVANILMITVLFLFIFAVMGVQLFNGKFFYCTDEAKRKESECKGQYFHYSYDDNGKQIMDPEVKQRKWTKYVLNFDTVYHAMLTLYTSSTGEGWPQAMHRTMDTTEKDQGPIQDHSTAYAIYYVSFVVVFSFFFLNIFVALIILTFQDLGEKEISNCELDRNQRDCIHFALTAKPGQMYMPRNRKSVQYKVWQLVTSKPFDIFIMVLISLNTVVLMMQYYDQPQEYKQACSWLNIAFTTLFTLEAVLKLIALRLNYFRDYWNLFDFVIVLGGLMDIAVTQIASQLGTKEDYIPIDPSMFRLFRAARLIKLLRQGYTIRILLWTFFRSFKALPYVTLLIALMFFMYAVIGMQLFGKIALDSETELNEYNNFRNILQALQVLFRSATGENWHLVMQACFTDAKCDKSIATSKNDKCGSTVLAVLYFCSFIFLCMFLMLNLFVAVIMDNFEYLTRDESILGPHHLDEFARVWSEYDPGATGFIHHKVVYKMMCSMSPPVGFGKKCPRIVGYKRLIKMNMPVNENGDVTFQTTLFALIRTSLNIKLRGNMNANDTELRKIMKRLWPNSTSNKVLDKLIPKQSVLSSQQMTIGKIYCAKLIHENYKYSRKREEEGEKPKSGFLRVVGSLRGHGFTTDHLPPVGHNSNYLTAAPRPRSRTLDSKFSSDLESRTSHTSSHPTGSDLNSVVRTRSWSSKANGDIEMMELKPASSKPTPWNGRPRTTDEPESSRPAIPLSYLAASRPKGRSNRNNSYSIAVDLEPREKDENDAEMRAITSQSPGAQSKRTSRDSKYYDEMISRINEQLTSAVESGQSPYAIYGMEENDENEWC